MKENQDISKHGGKREGSGRPKGSQNEKTKQWEVLGESIMNEHTDKFNKELRKLEGKEFINAYGMILEYFKPKQLRTEIKEEQAKEIIVRLPDDSKSKG